MKTVELPRLRCFRCQHEWTAKDNKLPLYCPRCHNPKWNQPRKKKAK